MTAIPSYGLDKLSVEQKLRMLSMLSTQPAHYGEWRYMIAWLTSDTHVLRLAVANLILPAMTRRTGIVFEEAQVEVLRIYLPLALRLGGMGAINAMMEYLVATGGRLGSAVGGSRSLPLAKGLKPLFDCVDDDLCLICALDYLLRPDLIAAKSSLPATWIWAILWLGHWQACAFASVLLNAEQTAAFAFSDVDRVDLDADNLPWRAFQIRFARGSFPGVERIAVTGPGEDDDAKVITVRVDLSSGESLWEINRSIDQLCEIANSDVDPDDTFDGSLPMEDADTRRLRAALRIFLTAWTIVNDSRLETGRTIGKRPKKRRQQLKAWPPRDSRLDEYLVLQPVDIDACESFHDYIEGKGNPRKVRWIRRGHFRRQHHGPHNTLVKRIWIQPHWCGPEGAPVAVRHHRIK